MFLIAGCVAVAIALVAPDALANESPDPATGEGPVATWVAEQSDEPDDIAMDNPGSIAEQFRRDRESKDYLVQIPGAHVILDPWSNLRTSLDEKYGFRPAFSFTHLYEWASETARPGAEDEGSGIEVAIDATWTFLGRGTDSPSMGGFEFLYRDDAGTDIPPAALFTQAGSLYPSTVAFGEVDPTIGQLWIQQIFKNKIGFRIGKYNPVPSYDFFPMKNFRTDFVDGIHAANVIIPLPSRGLGGYVMYRPVKRTYLRVGIHDANSETENVGFKSLFNDGELFKIFELGFDPGLAKREPGRPPPGDVHVSFWHQDKRDDDNVDSGWGFVLAGSQRFGRLLPFLRYGYSDSGRGGPGPIDHMINAGLAIDNILGQSNDRIGLGFTWSSPSNDSLDDQGAIDAFYRVQVTPQIALTPTVQMIIEPVNNPDEDVVWFLGFRSRFTF